MYDEHWSDDQLIDRLYGIGPEEGHLERCPSCARRWEAIRNRHESLRTGGADVSDELLAAQRRAIRTRLEEKSHALPRILIPVLVTLLLAAIVVLDKHAPTPKPAPVAEKISDAQLFDDVFSRVSDAEPSAIGPIRSLFEEKR